MRKSTGNYPSLTVDTTAKRVVSHAGAVLLAATIRKIGLDRELSAALRPWRRPLAVHDPGEITAGLGDLGRDRRRLPRRYRAGQVRGRNVRSGRFRSNGPSRWTRPTR